MKKSIKLGILLQVVLLATYITPASLQAATPPAPATTKDSYATFFVPSQNQVMLSSYVIDIPSSLGKKALPKVVVMDKDNLPPGLKLATTYVELKSPKKSLKRFLVLFAGLQPTIKFPSQSLVAKATQTKTVALGNKLILGVSDLSKGALKKANAKVITDVKKVVLTPLKEGGASLTRSGGADTINLCQHFLAPGAKVENESLSIKETQLLSSLSTQPEKTFTTILGDNSVTSKSLLSNVMALLNAFCGADTVDSKALTQFFSEQLSL